MFCQGLLMSIFSYFVENINSFIISLNKYSYTFYLTSFLCNVIVYFPDYLNKYFLFINKKSLLLESQQ